MAVFLSHSQLVQVILFLYSFILCGLFLAYLHFSLVYNLMQVHWLCHPNWVFKELFFSNQIFIASVVWVMKYWYVDNIP